MFKLSKDLMYLILMPMICVLINTANPIHLLIYKIILKILHLFDKKPGVVL